MENRGAVFCKHGWLFLIMQSLAGCGLVGTPTFDLLSPEPGTSRASQTTVNDVINHIACELATAMVNHLGDPNNLSFAKEGDVSSPLAAAPGGDESDAELWEHLIEDNFVSQINLSLQVTNSEGASPSANFITPFSPIPIPSLPKATNPSSFAGNFTLALGGQLSGTQYRTFVNTYQVDMAQLYRRMRWDYYSRDTDIRDTFTWVVYDAVPLDPRSKTGHSLALKPCVSTRPIGGSQLSGSLYLEEILVNGLGTIKQTKDYSMFTIPTGADAEVRVEIPVEPQQRLQQHFRFEHGPVQPPGPAAPTGGTVVKKAAKPAPPTPPISFGSDVDFTVVAGINGGPNWTETHFTGPGGGGGGGGGKGGGARGGGGNSGTGGSSGLGNSGGGGSGGLVNISRTNVDSLTMTVTATCRVGKPVALARAPYRDYWAAVPLCSDTDAVRQNLAAVGQTAQTNSLVNQFRRLLNQ